MSRSALHLEHELRNASPHASARQFVRLAHLILRMGNNVHDLNAGAEAGHLGEAAQRFMKAAVSANTIDSAWGESAGRELATSYLASVASGNLLDAIAAHALPIPADQQRVLIASGASANVAAEGDPKPVTKVLLIPQQMESTKIAALLVMSDELAKATDEAARRLFEAELRTAVVEAMNAAMLAAMLPGAISVVSTGDPVADMSNALDIASDSSAYVVAARRGVVRKLAIAAEGRMSVNGGQFIPGVTVVPVETDTSTPEILVIPASRIALTDFGLAVRDASHATVSMRSDPLSPAQVVSLWQTNCRALLVERDFKIHYSSPAVAVF